LTIARCTNEQHARGGKTRVTSISTGAVHTILDGQPPPHAEVSLWLHARSAFREAWGWGGGPEGEEGLLRAKEKNAL
jgi:hypothetical protein